MRMHELTDRVLETVAATCKVAEVFPIEVATYEQRIASLKEENETLKNKLKLQR